MTTVYKYGSSGDGVKELQSKLNQHGYQLEEDGVYGNLTKDAVTDYQKKNDLTVDGMAGSETLGNLGIGTASQTPQNTSRSQNNPTQQTSQASQKNIAETANEKLSTLQNGFSSSLDDTIDRLYDQILNREEFEYDPLGDASYNQYAETYKRNAMLMAEDSAAQAAALSGGYGSSYAQAVASQAYNDQMTKLNDIVPELRENAYNKYQDDITRDMEALSALINERSYDRSVFESDREYDRSVYEDERDYDRLVLESDREYEQNERAYERGVFESDRAYAEEQRQFNESLEEDKRQYDSALDADREAMAISAGFASYDEFLDAVRNGTLPESVEEEDYETFSLSEVQGAAEMFAEKGIEGVMDYASQLSTTNKNYSDEQIINLIFNASGLDKVTDYESAMEWLATTNYSGLSFNDPSYHLSHDTNIAHIKKSVKQADQWVGEPEYGSYAEYLRYTLLDLTTK